MQSAKSASDIYVYRVTILTDMFYDAVLFIVSNVVYLRRYFDLVITFVVNGNVYAP